MSIHVVVLERSLSGVDVVLLLNVVRMKHRTFCWFHFCSFQDYFKQLTIEMQEKKHQSLKDANIIQ